MKLLEVMTEEEVKDAVISEYEKRLLFNMFKDEQFKKKYGMNFENFEKENIVKKRDFTWEIEQDAMEWEHAVESIRHLKEKILKIKQIDE